MKDANGPWGQRCLIQNQKRNSSVQSGVIIQIATVITEQTIHAYFKAKMNCNNRACLYNLGEYESVSELLDADPNAINFDRYVGECTATPHNVMPTESPLNLCPRFVANGLQTGNEFAPWFNIDIAAGWHLTKEQNKEYFKCITAVRCEMHRKTL